MPTTLLLEPYNYVIIIIVDIPPTVSIFNKFNVCHTDHSLLLTMNGQYDTRFGHESHEFGSCQGTLVPSGFATGCTLHWQTCRMCMSVMLMFLPTDLIPAAAVACQLVSRCPLLLLLVAAFQGSSLLWSVHLSNVGFK